MGNKSIVDEGGFEDFYELVARFFYWDSCLGQNVA